MRTVNPEVNHDHLPRQEGDKQPKHGWLQKGNYREARGKRNDGILANLDDSLNGDIAPTDEIKYEKPVHRLMQEMSLEGYSNTEIANATGYTAERVSLVLRQPWARKRVIEQAKKGVKETLSAVLEELALPTLQEIVALGKKAETPAATQLACKQEVLNRFLGRPTQPILQEQKDPKSLSIEELDTEAAKIVAKYANNNNQPQPVSGLPFNEAGDSAIAESENEASADASEPVPITMAPPPSEY